MTKTRPGAWYNATRAISDAVQGFRDVPRPYIVVMVVTALAEFITLPLSLTPEDDVSLQTSLIVLGFILVAMFLMISPYIGLVRYFLFGDMSAGFDPKGPILRILGWAILLGVGTSIVPAIIAIFIFAASGDSSAVFLLVMALLFGLLMVFYLRLSTFFVALALDPPVSIKRCFAETRGHVWYIFRSVLASAVVLIPYVLAMIAIQIGIFGMDSFEADSVPTLTLGQRLLDALLSGVLGAAYFGYFTALYVRIFRSVAAN